MRAFDAEPFTYRGKTASAPFPDVHAFATMCCWRFGRTPRTTAAMERTMVRNTSAALREAGTTQAFHHRSTHELAQHPRRLSRGRSGAAAGRANAASRRYLAGRAGAANRRHDPGRCRSASRHARLASPHAASGPSASQHHAAAFGGRGLPDGAHRVHGRRGAVHRAHEFRLRLGRPRGNRRRRTAPGAVGALGRRRPKRWTRSTGSRAWRSRWMCRMA